MKHVYILIIDHKKPPFKVTKEKKSAKQKKHEGEIRWMNVTDYLKRKGPGTKQVEFEGEPFTAASLRRLRKRLL